MRNSETTLILLMMVLVSTIANDATHYQPNPVVKVVQGDVVGRHVHQQGAQLENYYAFEGIPYARPPVEQLRFKDPEEAESWSGIRNATTPGPICIQKNFINQEIIGQEDCLFINVYTAQLPSSRTESKFPVVVWVHPGAFSMGWGHLDFHRADDILRHEIVVVSFNYRLGVMGFLNTEDKEASGNAGLKDAVLALRWVKNNIGSFGGDSEKVTVFGSEAGGAIAHYLLLSPLTKGLIHGAMSMSGSALAPWASVSRPRRHALALREHFGGTCSNAGLHGIVSCLQSVDATSLVTIQNSSVSHEMFGNWKTPFLPSVEAHSKREFIFLPDEPVKLIRSGHFLQVPYITGFTSTEGISFLNSFGLLNNSSRWQEINKNFESIFRPAMPPWLRTKEAVRQMRDFYLGDQPLDADQELVRKFVQMCTDLFVTISSVSAARLMTQSGASVYVYNFSHEGPSSIPKMQLHNTSQMVDVTPGENLGHFFQFAQEDGDSSVAGSNNDILVRHQRIQIFADFARHGNPTPQPKDHLEWPLYTLQKEKYLDINTNIIVRDHVLGERISFWRRLVKCDGCQIHPVVDTEQGKVRGRQQESIANCSFYSWQGIPYAQPPTGSLRFKDANRPQRWLGIRDAQQEGNVCAQWSREGSVIGDEDCLFINLHSPQLPTWLSDTLPVMLWIHGGGFISGSGDQKNLGPDFFVCEDIIFISFNYRLGVLGFLYLESAAPGNAGLKDQVLAQRWVQRNIAAFGGDPRRVTLTGESAGGVSVHLHMLSPLSAGLFHQAIAQSGSALNPWAIQLDPLSRTQRLANELNCTMNDHLDIANCLRTVPLEKLISTSVLKANALTDRKGMLFFTFVPTTDYIVPGIETFLPLSAYELVTKYEHHAVPFLTGFTSLESALDLAYTNFRDPLIARQIDSSWNSLILPDLRLSYNRTRNEEALNDLRKFFMSGKALSKDNIILFMNMLTDIQFSEGIYYSIRHMVKAHKAPIYLYSFEIDDALNMLKLVLNLTDLSGAVHADELGYLFRISYLPNVTADSSAAMARRRMVKLWSNYVKTGNPTVDDDPLLERVRWLKYTKEEKNYLEITTTLRCKTNLNNERMNFWKQFYQTYGNETLDN